MTAATDLQNHLTAGDMLPIVETLDLPLAPGELPHADVTCMAARLYETPVHSPEGRAGYYENHPTFGQRWFPNPVLEERRRREAELDAQLRWRDHELCRVVLTSTGIHLKSGGEWVPFDHALLTDISPDQSNGSLALTYQPCPPLLLSGVAAPWLGLAISQITRRMRSPQ